MNPPSQAGRAVGIQGKPLRGEASLGHEPGWSPSKDPVPWPHSGFRSTQLSQVPGAVSILCWALLGCSLLTGCLGTPLHHYFKPNRLKRSESDFNSSSHTFRKGFLTDFLPQTGLGCVLSSGAGIWQVLVFVQGSKSAPYPVKHCSLGSWYLCLNSCQDKNLSGFTWPYSNPGEENFHPIEKTKHKLRGLIILVKVLTSDAFWK